jgi:alpha-glucosidase
MRHASRWNLSPAAQRGMTTLLMCLRGSACIYQGEELGLHEADVAFEDLQDPYGIQFWPEFKGRDGCRTPMVWTADNLNGGFSDARPWLPVSSEQLRNAVGEQEKHPDALLHHYRRAIAFRHAHPALASGTLEDLRAEGDVVSFVRRGDGETIYVALNLSDQPSTVATPDPEGWHHIGTELNSAALAPSGQTTLGPWQPCIALRKT